MSRELNSYWRATIGPPTISYGRLSSNRPTHARSKSSSKSWLQNAGTDSPGMLAECFSCCRQSSLPCHRRVTHSRNQEDTGGHARHDKLRIKYLRTLKDPPGY